MNGQDLYNARIVVTNTVVWYDGMTLKQYKAANAPRTGSTVYDKVYSVIAEADYKHIVKSVATH